MLLIPNTKAYEDRLPLIDYIFIFILFRFEDT